MEYYRLSALFQMFAVRHLTLPFPLFNFIRLNNSRKWFAPYEFVILVGDRITTWREQRKLCNFFNHPPPLLLSPSFRLCYSRVCKYLLLFSQNAVVNVGRRFLSEEMVTQVKNTIHICRKECDSWVPKKLKWFSFALLSKWPKAITRTVKKARVR